jgi:hypothetical protein
LQQLAAQKEPQKTIWEIGSITMLYGTLFNSFQGDSTFQFFKDKQFHF